MCAGFRMMTSGGVTQKIRNEDLGCDGVCFSAVKDCQMLYWGPVIIITSGGLIGLTIITALIVLRRRLYRMRQPQQTDAEDAIASVSRAEDRNRRRQQHFSRTRQILQNLEPFGYNPDDPVRKVQPPRKDSHAYMYWTIFCSAQPFLRK
eukprot:SAG31_NODE_2269_length_6047_cov_3.503699_3_plen_149_part_00